MIAIRKGKLKEINGLVDYIAEGELVDISGDRIPCSIGYNIYPSFEEDEDDILRADFIFIEKSGITESGRHYEKRTISLLAYLPDYEQIQVDDEEAIT